MDFVLSYLNIFMEGFIYSELYSPLHPHIEIREIALRPFNILLTVRNPGECMWSICSANQVQEYGTTTMF